MQWKASEKWKETWPHLSAFCTMKAAKGQELSWLEMREPGERTLTLWRWHTRHLPQWRHSSSVAILHKRLAMWQAILYKLPGVWKVSLRPRHSTISRYRCRILVDKLPKFLVEGNRWNKQGQRNLWTNQNCKWLCRNELETMFHYFLKYLILWMLHDVHECLYSAPSRYFNHPIQDYASRNKEIDNILTQRVVEGKCPTSTPPLPPFSR